MPVYSSHNPPNSNMDYSIFNVLYDVIACIHTWGTWVHSLIRRTFVSPPLPCFPNGVVFFFLCRTKYVSLWPPPPVKSGPSQGAEQLASWLFTMWLNRWPPGEPSTSPPPTVPGWSMVAPSLRPSMRTDTSLVGTTLLFFTVLHNNSSRTELSSIGGLLHQVRIVIYRWIVTSGQNSHL